MSDLKRESGTTASLDEIGRRRCRGASKHYGPRLSESVAYVFILRDTEGAAMRIGYSEDEDFAGQFNLWQANCQRSLNGRAGRSALRELEAALLAMPDKRLEMEVFVEPSGAVCALGALAVHRKMAAGMSRDEAVAACAELAPEDSQSHGMALGVPKLAAWKIVEINDIINDRYEYVKCEGPAQYGNEFYYKAGYLLQIKLSPEARYANVLAWVQEQLR